MRKGSLGRPTWVLGPTRRRPRRWWAVGAVAGALVAAVPAVAHTPPGGSAPPEILAPGWSPLTFEAPEPGTYALPPLGPAADAPVLASDGRATTLHALYGDGAVVLSFIYTTCRDANGCPLATAVLKRAKTRLDEDPALRGRLRLVSVSIDPAHDNPARMERYGGPLRGAGIPWHFVTTSSEEALAPILERYGQAVTRDYDAAGRYLGTMSHVLRVYLIDPARRIRNVYSVSFLHADTLVNDVRTVLAKAPRPAGATAGADDGPRGEPLRTAATDLHGAGDDKTGYDDAGYRTRSRDLPARRGRATDLAALVAAPPLGLPAVPVPADNPVTRAKIALGRRLFYDRRLSLNDTFSCAMCHVPEQGFTSNEIETAVGIEGRTVRRNAPTLYNVAYLERLFHDGREHRLEQQVWGPLLARNEMGNPSVGVVVEKIRGLADYDGAFEAAFDGRGPGMLTIGQAIASYERTLLAAASPFDRWHFGGEEDAVGARVKRGFALFTGKAGCAGCHTVADDHALFTDGALHNTGLGHQASMRQAPPTRTVFVAPGTTLEVPRAAYAAAAEPPPNDLGLYEVTQDPADRWKYRTPTLRNVALTAPYMHDGSVPTLRAVVEHYARGGVAHALLSPRIRPLDLSEAEIEALVALLESLTASNVDLLLADAFAAPIGDVGRTGPE